MPGLGRLPASDARDHPMRALLGPQSMATYKFWTPGVVLNQRDTPQCVGYAWTGWELCTPVPDKLSEVDSPAALYHAAQLVDEWAGVDYDGTSVRAGAKVLQAQGRLKEYVFDTDVPTAIQWVLTKGPLVFGTNWYAKMFEVGSDGYAHLGGGIAGGHAYLCYGVNSRREAFACRNSWGSRWGNFGSFWLSFNDAARLFAEDGEACAAAEVIR